MPTWLRVPPSPRRRSIIVPRYPADAEVVEQRAAARGLAVTRKTAVDSGAARPPGGNGVLVVDTVGELGRLYAIADLAFVGGSLFFRGANKGGHNLMEPAIFGVPVLFGPYNFSFKETVDDLLAADAGKLVRDAAELRAARRRRWSPIAQRGARSGSARSASSNRAAARRRATMRCSQSCCTRGLESACHAATLGPKCRGTLSTWTLNGQKSTSSSATSIAAPISCS